MRPREPSYPKDRGSIASLVSPQFLVRRGQAQIPIYYWFIRTFENIPKEAELIRAFLDEFEHDRRIVRSEMTRRSRGEDIQITDQDLMSYNTLMRTPDDKRNQEGMYRILQVRFLELLRSVFEKFGKDEP